MVSKTDVVGVASPFKVATDELAKRDCDMNTVEREVGKMSLSELQRLSKRIEDYKGETHLLGRKYTYYARNCQRASGFVQHALNVYKQSDVEKTLSPLLDLAKSSSAPTSSPVYRCVKMSDAFQQYCERKGWAGTDADEEIFHRMKGFISSLRSRLGGMFDSTGLTDAECFLINEIQVPARKARQDYMARNKPQECRVEALERQFLSQTQEDDWSETYPYRLSDLHTSGTFQLYCRRDLQSDNKPSVVSQQNEAQAFFTYLRTEEGLTDLNKFTKEIQVGQVLDFSTQQHTPASFEQSQADSVDPKAEASSHEVHLESEVTADFVEVERLDSSLRDIRRVEILERSAEFGSEGHRFAVDITTARAKGIATRGIFKHCCEDYAEISKVQARLWNGSHVDLVCQSMFDGGGGHVLAAQGERYFSQVFSLHLQDLIDARQAENITPEILARAFQRAHTELFSNDRVRSLDRAHPLVSSAYLRQGTAFRNAVQGFERLAKELGIPWDGGKELPESLSGAREGIRAAVVHAYKDFLPGNLGEPLTVYKALTSTEEVSPLAEELAFPKSSAEPVSGPAIYDSLSWPEFKSRRHEIKDDQVTTKINLGKRVLEFNLRKRGDAEKLSELYALAVPSERQTVQCNQLVYYVDSSGKPRVCSLSKGDTMSWSTELRPGGQVESKGLSEVRDVAFSYYDEDPVGKRLKQASDGLFEKGATYGFLHTLDEATKKSSPVEAVQQSVNAARNVRMGDDVTVSIAEVRPYANPESTE